jgi:phosphoribosylamine--glycine ligase
VTRKSFRERVLVVGGGGREHALAWAARRSPEVGLVLAAPGNPGTREVAENISVAATDARALAELAVARGVTLAVLGPDAAVAAGVGDALSAAGIPCFGPTVAAGRLETSKVFAKQLMQRLGVPTADFRVCSSWEEAQAQLRGRPGEVVVKADGLALGKGAFVCAGTEEALEVARRLLVELELGEAGRQVVLEERLHGEEASFFALCDGTRARMLPPARDYKAALEGDKGPNTGGMGACAPPQLPSWEELNQQVLTKVVEPVLAEMARLSCPFVGCLYVGGMVVSGEVQVLEFNARFGDPEAEVLLPWLPDLLPQLGLAARGRLEPGVTPHPPGASVGVVAVRHPYPAPVQPGGEVLGLDHLPEGCLAFQMGTRAGAGGRPEVSGGRVVIVVGSGIDLGAARELAYRGIRSVQFPGMRYRADIAAPADDG